MVDTPTIKFSELPIEVGDLATAIFPVTKDGSKRITGDALASWIVANYSTAADILAKLLTVDGPASGLDADTLDGFQAANLVALGDIGSLVQAYDADLSLFAAAGPAALSNYISGLTLSNDGTDPTNDIVISKGACTDSTNAKFLVLASALTKRSDAAWAAGSGNGWLDTGTIADGSYHAWLIMRSDTGAVDSLLSLSATAPTMPANYDYKRRIGSVIRSGGAIVKFFQFGDKFLLDVPSTALAFTQNATAALRVLNDIPLGIRVEALIRAMATNGGSAFFATITSPDTAATAPAASATPLADLNGATGTFDRETFSVMTDTSGQVRTIANTSATEMDIVTLGWIDRRGKE